MDEIKILQTLAKHDPKNSKCVVSLLDWFEHKGPHGKRKEIDTPEIPLTKNEI